MLKAVLFDLDFTLIDWEAAEPWEDYQSRRLHAVRDFVHEHLYPLPEIDGLAMFMAYVSALQRAWQASNETLIAPDVKLILRETLREVDVPLARIDLDALVRAYDWGPAAGERAYPDVLEVLPEFKLRGIALGIVTNASHPMVDRDKELRATGLMGFFPDCRVAAVDVGVIKPHRAIFEIALQQLGVQPGEAVFVGDNLWADVKGAQDAGMWAVWRKGPDAESQRSEQDGHIVPDATITTLHDLLPLLDDRFPGWRNGAES